MIAHFKGSLPFIMPDQMAQIEKLLSEDYGISTLQVLENAGLNLAVLARDKFLGNEPNGKKVVVVTGPGSNGGGAMVAARRLRNWGASVSLLLTEPNGKFEKETVEQFSICQKQNIPIVETIGKANLVIDGIKGYEFKGRLSNYEIKIVGEINDSGIPVLAFEMPTGLDLSTGSPGEKTIKAEATLGLAIPKYGHFRQKAAKFIGELFLSDICVPVEIYKSLKIPTENLARAFGESPVVKINKIVVFS